MNIDKARFAVWSVLRKELHDSLTLCNWMYPLVASPLKSRGYEGDNGVEAQLYSLVTGDKKDAAAARPGGGAHLQPAPGADDARHGDGGHADAARHGARLGVRLPGGPEAVHARDHYKMDRDDIETGEGPVLRGAGLGPENRRADARHAREARIGRAPTGWRARGCCRGEAGMPAGSFAEGASRVERLRALVERIRTASAAGQVTSAADVLTGCDVDRTPVAVFAAIGDEACDVEVVASGSASTSSRRA